MTKKILMLLFAFALVLVAAPRGSAQTTAPTEVMYHWCAIHKGPGQAVVLNFQLTDHIGSPITVPVEIRPIQPCIKLDVPPGPGSPLDLPTPTLEVMDVLTGRVLEFANNPHTII